MFNKRNVLTIFLFLSLVMMCLSVAWASDDVTQSDSIDQSISDDTSYEIDDNKEVKIEKTEEVISQKLESTNTVSNYNQLYELINKKSNDKTLNIVLEKGKNFTVTKTIHLKNQNSKNINIKGSGNNFNNIRDQMFLDINSDTYNVTISNVTFSNIRMDTHNFINNYGNLTISNSTVKNNLFKCCFIDNSGNLTLNRINLNHNIVDGEGKIFIHSNGLFKIVNSNITSNKLHNDMIYSELAHSGFSEILFKNVLIDYNVFDMDFIHLYNINLRMDNITFKKNDAFNYMELEESDFILNNSNIISNTGYYLGYITSSNVNITNNRFFSNDIGGIFLICSESNVTMDKNQFKYNTINVCIDLIGGEEENSIGTNSSITNSLFEKNNGLLIDSMGTGNIKLHKCVFIKNMVNTGVGLLSIGGDYLTISCCKFNYNTIEEAALITAYVNTILEFNTFLNNNALGDLSLYYSASVYKNTFTNTNLCSGIAFSYGSFIIRKNLVNYNKVDTYSVYLTDINNTIMEYNTINVNKTDYEVIGIVGSDNTRIYSNNITSKSNGKIIALEEYDSARIYNNYLKSKTSKGNNAVVNGNGILVYNNIPT